MKPENYIATFLDTSNGKYYRHPYESLPEPLELPSMPIKGWVLKRVNHRDTGCPVWVNREESDG